MAKVAKKAGPRKAANGYKLPEPIPKGEIVTDLKKQQWIIGPSIGVGGFGEIYSAAMYKGKNPQDYDSVIKIEPHENGPLFVEMHFYLRNAQASEIEKWKKEHKIKFLGMPRFLASGSHERKGNKYRFLAMDRYGTDLWKLFLENGRSFPDHTIYKVAWHIINILEYIHGRSYVHGDIKGANLMLDRKNQDQVYLLDFGLACKVNSKEEYKLNPKKAHNGTIEYTSRDNHMGVPTMRGDLEILAYNMVQWSCGKLPWEDNLKNPSTVHSLKEKAFSDINKFLTTCYKSGEIPKPMKQFLTSLAALKFDQVPKYEEFRKTLELGLKELGQSVSGKLEFTKKVTATKKPDAKKRNVEADSEEDIFDSPKVRKPVMLKKPQLDSSVEEVIPKPKSRKAAPKKAAAKKKLDDSVDSEEEMLIPKARKFVTKRETPKTTPRRAKIIDDSLDSVDEINDSAENIPTPKVRKPVSRNKRKSSDDVNESVFMDESCITGKDLKKKLLSLQAGSEYEVRIKRKK